MFNLSSGILAAINVSQNSKLNDDWSLLFVKLDNYTGYVFIHYIQFSLNSTSMLILTDVLLNCTFFSEATVTLQTLQKSTIRSV